MVDTICPAFDARLARIVDDLSKHRLALAENVARNVALRSAMVHLCTTLRAAVTKSRYHLTRIAKAGAHKRPAAARASRIKSGGLPPARLRRVMAYIDASLDRRLDVPSLAAVAGMSPGHFAAMFKRATGLPPHEAVTRRRLARSQELLAKKALGIAEISCQLGFSSHAHFCTTFRRHFGVSPTAWRAQQLRRATSADRSEHSTFSGNTKSSPEISESRDRFGCVLLGMVTEPPLHADTGASRPGTA